MTEFCQLQLTCTDEKEALDVADKLLKKRLIACAKQMPITSDFHWQGKIEHAEEVFLVMESKLDFFKKVEAEVSKLHSYDTFVLEAIPIAKVSKEARNWMENELGKA